MVEDNIKKLYIYDLSYFNGRKYFNVLDGKQNYLVFLPMRKYFKLSSIAGVIDHVLSWGSKGISIESIKSPTTSNYSLNPKLTYYGTKTRIQFIRSCLKQRNFTFTHKKVVDVYIVYELRASSSHINDPALKNCLFGAVTLTKNADIKNIDILVMALGLRKFFISRWRIRLKCINFWSRYEFFYTY